jgi:small subunit ribosomal protein S9
VVVLSACSSGGSKGGPSTVIITKDGSTVAVSTSGSPSPTVHKKKVPVHVSLNIGDGAQVGIGLPIIATFKQKITDGRAFQAATKVTVNGKDAEKYFPGFELPNMLKVPFTTIGMEGKFDVIADAQGGGLRGQADAVRLGISRALLEFNPEFRASLKKQGFLKRDARVRERKKYGKKGARRSPQWAKR